MEEFRFKLKGKTLVIVDWANVYGWFEKLKWEIDPEKLFEYLKSYPEIYDIRFYFGIEKGNGKSERFHQYIKHIGYTLINKEVKWVPAEVKISSYIKFKNQIVNLLSIDKFKRKEFDGEVKKFENIIKQLRLVRRKCDFDVEITLDVMKEIEYLKGLILFSGDGDFKALCEHLLDKNKQVIVVHPFGLRGKEYNELLTRPKGKRPYLCAVEKLTSYIKKSTPESFSGA